MKLIAHQTVGSSVQTYTFSSIPSNYKHLVIQAGSVGLTGATARGNMTINFNGNTSNYGGTSGSHIYINGSINNVGYTYSNSGTINLTYNLIGYDEAYSATFDIMNANSATAGKSVLANSGAPIGVSTEMYGVNLFSGYWADNSPITSVSVSIGSAGRVGIISLYGIEG